jgi:hypothetical protein
VLESRGIRAGTIDLDTVRLVTHKDVDDADVDRTIATFDALALDAVEPRRSRLPADDDGSAAETGSGRGG